MGHMSLDPVADLLLDEAGAVSGRILVVDDAGGALTRWALDAGADVRSWCDDLRDEWDIPEGARTPTLGVGPDGWRPDLVLWRLPKAVSAVEDIAERLAVWVAPDARVLAGGRTKHMTLAQNGALARSFATVSASLGRQKSRVLRAADPRPVAPRWPARRYVGEVGLTVVARGATFNTVRLDDGTRALVRALGRSGVAPGAGRRALDLGCGSGILAAWLAQRGFVVTGSDVAASAVEATALTASANGVEVAVRRASGFEGVADAAFDLIVSNPPFHRGTEKDSTPTFEMIADARRVLTDGGEVWLVYNSHLPYLPALRRDIGPTQIVARDRHYVVTRTLAG